MAIPDPTRPDYIKFVSMLPQHMRQPMVNYIEKGFAPGGFLNAVVANNLKEAVARADSINRHYLPEYADYLTWYAPASCWGSQARVDAWVVAGGLEGLREKEKSDG